MKNLIILAAISPALIVLAMTEAPEAPEKPDNVLQFKRVEPHD